MTTAMPSPAVAVRTSSGWKGFGLVAWYSFWKLLTNPFSLGFAILLPIFMYMMFGAGRDYSDIWTVHANVAATVLVNMTLYGVIIETSSMGANVALERTSGISRLYALTPLSSTALTLARALASMCIAAVVIAVTFTVGALTGARMEGAAWASVCAILLVTSVMPTTIGLAIAFAVRSDGAFAASSAVTVLSSFAAGMFIPIEQMGQFWARLAPWTPFYGISQIAQCPLYGWEAFKWSWIASIAVWTALFGLLAVWAQQRDTTR